MKTWTCKIGSFELEILPAGSDFPIRMAVERAYKEITGKNPDYVFSGWGGELDPDELIVAKNMK